MSNSSLARFASGSSLSGEGGAEFTSEKVDLQEVLNNKNQLNFEVYMNFVNIDVVQQVAWVRVLVDFISSQITHIMALLVLIFSIYFRLAVSMWVYILLYMNYYWQLNRFIFDKMEEYRLQQRLFNRIQKFKEEYILLGKKENPEEEEKLKSQINNTYGELNLEKLKKIEANEIKIRMEKK